LRDVIGTLDDPAPPRWAVRARVGGPACGASPPRGHARRARRTDPAVAL